MSTIQTVSTYNHVDGSVCTNPVKIPSNNDDAGLGGGGEGEDGRTCRRHISHGRMKYRGSTKGAVMSERAVEVKKMRTKETRKQLDSLPACAVWVALQLTAVVWTSACPSLRRHPLLSVTIAAHEHTRYTGMAANLITE